MLDDAVQAVQNAHPTITLPAGIDWVKFFGIPARMIEESKSSYSSAIILDAQRMTYEERILASYLSRR